MNRRHVSLAVLALAVAFVAGYGTSSVSTPRSSEARNSQTYEQEMEASRAKYTPFVERSIGLRNQGDEKASEELLEAVKYLRAAEFRAICARHGKEDPRNYKP